MLGHEGGWERRGSRQEKTRKREKEETGRERKTIEMKRERQTEGDRRILVRTDV